MPLHCCPYARFVLGLVLALLAAAVGLTVPAPRLDAQAPAASAAVEAGRALFASQPVTLTEVLQEGGRTGG
ncbi:MAG: hypothetical protein FJW23_08640 [Acidimicrobiia bacterium]|nr:hypothetical protein [Acidimicrobiia bacterium]